MKRACYNCQMGNVCFARVKLDEIFMEKSLKVNIDGDSAPGKMLDVYDALANCCTQYISNE